MLVVLSAPGPMHREAERINALFEEGMGLFHLRKPGMSAAALRLLLSEVKTVHHHKIALHQHHAMARDFNINRLHFTADARSKCAEALLMGLCVAGKVLSTSIHDTVALDHLADSFRYVFFSPVFDSISKQNYKAVVADGFVFPRSRCPAKVMALGGIHAGNIQQLGAMNFDGAAVLGAVWQQPEAAIQQFKTLQKLWNNKDR